MISEFNKPSKHNIDQKVSNNDAISINAGSIDF